MPSTITTLTSSDPSVNKSSTFNLESMLSFICCASSVVVGKCKDFREGFCEAGELTRTFLRQGLLPGGVSSNLFDGLVVCSGVLHSAPLELCMSLYNVPKFRIFRAHGLHTRFETKARFKHRNFHVLNLMQMRKSYCFRSFALDSAHVKFDV